jgi:hypothetical protein
VKMDITDCQERLDDPILTGVTHGQTPSFDEIAGLFPRPQGEPAFDPELISANVERLTTRPAIDTGITALDNAIKVGLAHIDATFQGDHPKYGVKGYASNRHDGFPPTIIAAVDALSAWGLDARAIQIFRYWMREMVNADGSIKYVGTSIAEFGQLLDVALILAKRCGTKEWWNDCFRPLDSIAELLLRLSGETGSDGLIFGCPEDDERERPGKYFHCSAWAARGLESWAILCGLATAAPSTPATALQETADRLKKNVIVAIRRTWPEDPNDWWLPPHPETRERPKTLSSLRLATYTNYRYWPELLSSGILPHDLANRLVNARLTGGGQFCGMTRYYDRLDDWPLVDYLYGLWQLGRKQDFLLSLYGHIAYHQADGHLTAYEQMTFPPGREKTSYCLPCQLVAARAGRLLV